MRLNDATPADWDRVRKQHPAIEKTGRQVRKLKAIYWLLLLSIQRPLLSKLTGLRLLLRAKVLSRRSKGTQGTGGNAR